MNCLLRHAGLTVASGGMLMMSVRQRARAATPETLLSTYSSVRRIAGM
jgi:hypothetical protein